MGLTNVVFARQAAAAGAASSAASAAGSAAAAAAAASVRSPTPSLRVLFTPLCFWSCLDSRMGQVAIAMVCPCSKMRRFRWQVVCCFMPSIRTTERLARSEMDSYGTYHTSPVRSDVPHTHERQKKSMYLGFPSVATMPESLWVHRDTCIFGGTVTCVLL